MNFNIKLNKYLDEIKYSSKDLSIETGISLSAISRYRSGERTPKHNSDQLIKISEVIQNEIKNLNIKKYKDVDILEDLNNLTEKKDNFDYELFSKNFNILINEFKININDMSKYIVFDPSHISRIRYGKAKPSDPINFSTKVCKYIMSRYNSDNEQKKLYRILNIDKKLTEQKTYKILYDFLVNAPINQVNNNYAEKFLENLNDFNLNDYIKAIKFDELKVPSIPFYKGKTKHYYGLDEMKEGELNFFKATVLSKSKEDIFMCSDMPMDDMAKDIDFGKKWMFAIAMCLKKGLHLNIIHNLDRPFDEMMLGIESWIPIYMTGQVSPYYLKEVKNSVYHHFNYSSGVVALYGECIKGYHNKGMYYLTTKQNEVAYYKEKNKLLLKKAYSLMDIYKEINKKEYHLFLDKDKYINSDRVRYLSSLPLFTINDDLLIKILKNSNINDKEIKEIIKYKSDEKDYLEYILKSNSLTDFICISNKKDYKENENYLLLSNMFYSKNITYSYEEYKEHLKSTKEYAKNNKNYKVIENRFTTFKNITITICGNNYVIIHKNANPTIHFVIRHPKLVDAIKNFNPLVKE